MTDLIGRTIGKYRIVARLGRGGMAEVYKAYQPGLDRYVAIKVLHSHLADDPDFIRRFKREAKAVANLRHPNIVQVFDFDIQDDMYYMVMELVEGPTLKKELQTRSLDGTSFTLGQIALVMAALCSGIDYAHRHGMVHRDLKPANFILTQDGQILILDFGIARIVDTTKLTASGVLSGTPAYMSPEQGQGEPGDERSDIYALGVVLYEMATGRVPFDADTPFAVIMKHITAPLPLPTEVNPNIPENVERVILKAMSKEPADRFQTGAELAETLKEAVELSPYDTLNRSPVLPLATPPKVDELSPSDPTFSATSTDSQVYQSTLKLENDTDGQTKVVRHPEQTQSKKLPLIIGGIISIIIIIGLAIWFFSAIQTSQVNQTATLIAQNSAQTATAEIAETETNIVETSVALSATPDTANEPTPTDTPSPTSTPDLDATIDARLDAREAEAATETAASISTQTASVPTPTDTPIPTETPISTDTPVPTDTPSVASNPPTSTSLPLPTSSPTPEPTPIPPTPAVQVTGRIAVPVDNGRGFYDVYIYDVQTGQSILKIEAARQPNFRSDGLKLLINGEGGGRNDIWEINASTGNFEKAVSSSPSDAHPFYSPQGDRLVYGNPNLAIGSDGNNHPYIFVQCSLNRPQDEGEEKCQDVARFLILVPEGQIGEIQGSNPIWTADDRIAYKGCNTWQGGNSCGIFIVVSWANKRSGQGATPVKIAGIDGTSTTPTDAQGNSLLYHALQNGNWDIFISPLGGGPVNLTNTPSANDGLGTFSPDGRSVAFVSNRDGGWAIWVVPTSGGTATKLFNLPPNPWGGGDRDWTNERISWGP